MNGLSEHELQWLLTSTRINEWLQHGVFHFHWWLLLGIFAISVYVWWKMVDKSRLSSICLYAALISVITLALDELGEELTLWYYPYDLVPIFPPLTAIDLASLPLVYSMIYQYFSTWKAFISAAVVMAAIFCFILEPFFVWIGIYQTLTWKYYYGFPIYIAMAICIRAIVIGGKGERSSDYHG